MIYAFLPFMSSALYGLGYVLLERVLKSVNILTYTVCSGLMFSAILVTVAFFRRGDFQPSVLLDKRVLLLFLATVIPNVIGWLITLNSLQRNTAVYTAFAEISYPLFTILFAAVFFGLRQFGWQTALGGAFIFIGSLILISAQSAAKP